MKKIRLKIHDAPSKIEGWRLIRARGVQSAQRIDGGFHQNTVEKLVDED
jgi:hypothetical protein